MTQADSEHAVLLLHCASRLDAVSVISDFFAEQRLRLDTLVQFTDAQTLLLRATWVVEADQVNDESIVDALAERFSAEFGADQPVSCTLRFPQQGRTVGLLCSAQTHVLNDVLSSAMASQNGRIKVPFVIGVDDAASKVADRFGVPFFRVSDRLPATELAQRQIDIIRRYKPDILGLARYDALLGESVIRAANCPILAVHNSFLRTVKSEKAFELAHEQGVKMVGATSRFVEGKSAGPIISQDVVRLSPGVSRAHVIRLGQQVERKVFTESLRKLVEHRVMVYNAKTIVFD